MTDIYRTVIQLFLFNNECTINDECSPHHKFQSACCSVSVPLHTAMLLSLNRKYPFFDYREFNWAALRCFPRVKSIINIHRYFHSHSQEHVLKGFCKGYSALLCVFCCWPTMLWICLCEIMLLGRGRRNRFKSVLNLLIRMMETKLIRMASSSCNQVPPMLCPTSAILPAAHGCKAPQPGCPQRLRRQEPHTEPAQNPAG